MGSTIVFCRVQPKPEVSWDHPNCSHLSTSFWYQRYFLRTVFLCPKMYFCFIVNRPKVQNWSLFLLINKSGGNRNSFHLSCVFIKGAHAISENLRYFVRYLVRHFPARSSCSLHRLPGYQNGKTAPDPRKGVLDLGLKFMSWWFKSFHPDALCFVSLFLLLSLPSLHPKGEEQAVFLLAACLPDTCPASVGAASHPPAPSAAYPLCCFPPAAAWVDERRETPSAEAQQTMDLAQPHVRARPEAADVKVALLHTGRASFTVSGSRNLSNSSVREPFG